MTKGLTACSAGDPFACAWRKHARPRAGGGPAHAVQAIGAGRDGVVSLGTDTEGLLLIDTRAQRLLESCVAGGELLVTDAEVL